MSHPDGTTQDAATELAALSLAMQRTLGRRAALGRRTLPQVQAPDPLGAPAAPSAAPSPPRGPSGGPAPSPGPSPGPAISPAPGAAPRPATGPAPSTDHSLPNLLAERAAAAATLDELRGCVEDCTACELSRSRSRTVFGDGLGTRRILFVGEAPGEEEDRRGVPFVGAAGALLDDIITKGMGIAREDVYIANVLKCRPPGNRDPLPAEKALCTAWLDRQIELLDPLVIIPLGRHAAGHVLGVDAPMGRLRGKVHDRDGRKVVPTYHPAYLLRSPHEKRKTWADIQLAMGVAGLPTRGA